MTKIRITPWIWKRANLDTMSVPAMGKESKARGEVRRAYQLLANLESRPWKKEWNKRPTSSPVLAVVEPEEI
jgi:hypothetical protein